MKRTTGRSVPKPLVRVRGASLLERNVCSLVGAGFERIWVACLETQHSIREEVACLAERVRPRGVGVETVLEPEPLGTVGAAGLLRDRAQELLVINADNLCALDLGLLVDHHTAMKADLTLASHLHVDQLPYGELHLEGGRVAAYVEKPTRHVQVSSAICVLGPKALALLNGRFGLPDLAARLLECRGEVCAFVHDAPWVDVNEARDISRASALVAANAGLMERWRIPPDFEVVGAIIRDEGRILLERRRDVPAAEQWDTPGGKTESGETPAAALVRELREELGLAIRDPGPCVTCFDSIDSHGRIGRHHVFEIVARAAQVRAVEGQLLAWFSPSTLPQTCSRVVTRSLAWCDGIASSSRPAP